MAPRYGRPEVERADWWTRLWRPFWVRPAVVAAVSTALGVALPHADQLLAGWVPYVFESGPDGGRQLLGTIASAMISVTGLVFSLTMVVLHLANTQFSPRLLGDFLQSRVVQYTLGVFTGSSSTPSLCCGVCAGPQATPTSSCHRLPSPWPSSTW